MVLTEAAWRKYFAGGGRMAGRVVTVDGRNVPVVGVIPGDSWRLPGRVDGWLLDDKRGTPANGFVVARMNAGGVTSRRFWWVSVPDGAGGFRRFQSVSLGYTQPILIHLLLIALAMLLLPATTSLALGEYPASRHAPEGGARFRRWIFLAIKIPPVLAIVFFGTLDLASLSRMEILPHGWMIGYLLALRWILTDQRRRCPVCLRLVSSPMQVGRTSQTFLEWYGTELACPLGHGLLHVPELRTASCNRQQWLYLDASWSGLFVPARRGTEPGLTANRNVDAAGV